MPRWPELGLSIQLEICSYLTFQAQNCCFNIFLKPVCLIHIHKLSYEKPLTRNFIWNGTHLLLAYQSLLTCLITANTTQQYHETTEGCPSTISLLGKGWDEAGVWSSPFPVLSTLYHFSAHWQLYHQESSLGSYQQCFPVTKPSMLSKKNSTKGRVLHPITWKPKYAHSSTALYLGSCLYPVLLTYHPRSVVSCG